MTMMRKLFGSLVLAAVLALVPIAADSTLTSSLLNPAGGCGTIEAYGGAQSLADNTPAFNRWAAQLSSAKPQRCLELASGDYTFLSGASAIQPPATTVDVHGKGQGITKSHFPNGGGFTFAQVDTASATSVSGMSVLTSKPGTGNGVTVSNSQCLGSHPTNRFLDLHISDETGGGATGNYFGAGVYLVNISTWVVDRLNYYGQLGATSTGNSVYWSGSATGGANNGPCYGIVGTVTNSTPYNAANGVLLGGYVQGLHLENDNFTNGTGVGLTSLSSSLGINDVRVNSSQFNTYGSAAIWLQGQVSDVFIGAGNLIYVQPGKYGIIFGQTTARNCVVTGGTELVGVGTGSVGISNTGCKGAMFTGAIYETLTYGNIVSANMNTLINHNLYDQVVSPNGSVSATGNTLDPTYP